MSANPANLFYVSQPLGYQAQVPALAAQGVQPVTTVGNAPAYPIGVWRNPPGWKPQALCLVQRMCDGGRSFQIVTFPPAEYVRVGGKGGSRMAPPKHLQRERKCPKLVTPATAYQEWRLLSFDDGKSGAGAIPASQMPPELLDMVIDCYGASDLPPDVAALCRARIAALEEEKRAREAAKKAKPAAAGKTASTATEPRRAEPLKPVAKRGRKA